MSSHSVSAQKATQKTTTSSKQAAGPNGVSKLPPDYGVDAVDSGLAAQLETANPPLTLQAKLEVGEPGDASEQEADAMADWALQTGAPGSESGTSDNERIGHEAPPSIQRAAIGVQGVKEVPSSVHETLMQAGQPLDTSTRTFMESRFGQDFGDVRVHTDAKAAESAQAVNALAYTVGTDVVFGTEQYAPRTTAGRRLLIHELSHVTQQAVSHAPRLQRQPQTSVGEGMKPTAATAGQSTLQFGEIESIRATLIRYYQEADMIQLPKDPMSAASMKLLVPIIGAILAYLGIPLAGIAVGVLRAMVDKDAARFVAFSKAGVDPIPYFTACLSDMDSAVNKFFYQALTLLVNSRQTAQPEAKKNLEASAQFYFSKGVSLLLTYREFMKGIGAAQRMEEMVTIDQAQTYWKELEACADSIAETKASIIEQAQRTLP